MRVDTRRIVYGAVYLLALYCWNAYIGGYIFALHVLLLLSSTNARNLDAKTQVAHRSIIEGS